MQGMKPFRLKGIRPAIVFELALRPAVPLSVFRRVPHPFTLAFYAHPFTPHRRCACPPNAPKVHDPGDVKVDGTLVSCIDPLQAESLHRHRTAQLVVEGEVGQRAAGLEDLWIWTHTWNTQRNTRAGEG